MSKQSQSYWLLKSEPDCYSIADLERDQVEMWDGTRNYQVRNMMRDDMQVGDRALFYHSNAGNETGVVGVMEIVKAAYPDPTQFDQKSEHPDPKSDPASPRWLCVDVKYLETLPRVVTLAEIKSDPKLEGVSVAKKGNRLSVMPVSKKHFERIVALATT
ncbi:EVE domain-containing protein [Candidatus Pacebacteria bacterium]|nr:EVE domain-containing protein [Candidatus Paceibacterota bacterium]